LTFEDLILFILNKNGLTQAMELFSYYQMKNQENITKQAFSKSRKNLNPKMFKSLNQEYIRDIYENTDYKRFKDHIVLAIDGSVQELVNKPILKEEYGGITNNGEIVSVNARSSGVYDCFNDLMIDFEIEPYKTSEKELAIKNIENTLKFFEDEKIIMIFDRGYPSIELFYYLEQLGVNFIFRIKESSYKYEKSFMKRKDEFVDLKITPNRTKYIKDPKIKKELIEKEELKLRIMKIKSTTGEEKHLISNLPMQKFRYGEIKTLYSLRWEIEKSFEVLKNKLQIENISGYSQLAVKQDFYAQILTYNICQDIKREANKKLTLKKETKIQI
jgi:hypothetical protein